MTTTKRQVSRSFARQEALRTPREHGFWALLAISLLGGVLFAPSWRAAAAAGLVGLLGVLAAMLLGRRIRKNAPLQTLASLVLAAAAAPIVLAGGGTLGGAALLCGTLGVAYLSGTLSVRAVLERAKKRLAQAKVTGALSVGLPMAGVLIAYMIASPRAFAALGVTTLYTTTTFVLKPRARNLKLIGMSLAFAHALSVALLVAINSAHQTDSQ